MHKFDETVLTVTRVNEAASHRREMISGEPLGTFDVGKTKKRRNARTWWSTVARKWCTTCLSLTVSIESKCLFICRGNSRKMYCSFIVITRILTVVCGVEGKKVNGTSCFRGSMSTGCFRHRVNAVKYSNGH
jgi:hypothetical protein